MEAHLIREDHITHEGSVWVLRSRKTGKVLGRHPSKASAEAQERAVRAHSDTRFDRRARAIARPRQPTAIAVAFESWLVAWSRSLDREIIRTLAAEGVVRRDEDALVVDLSRTDVDRLVKAVERRMRKLVSRGSLLGKLEQLAKRTERFSRDEWRRQLHAAIGIDPAEDADVSDLIDEFREQNVRRIVTLADEKIDRVRDILQTAGPGARVETVTDRIHEQLDVTESHARLIARTETSTLASRMAQAQHEAAGITEFIWRTSLDERVRESHAALEGTRWAYSAPPLVDGERITPGTTYNCRCTSEAIIDLGDDSA